MYGSTRLVLSDESHRHAKAFEAMRSGTVPQTWPYLFTTTSGGSLPSSHLTTAMTEAFRRDGLVVLDRRGNACTITATQLRKAHIAHARSAGRQLATCTTCRATCSIVSPRSRRVTTSPIATHQSVLVYRRMIEDTYRRRTPAASPPPGPSDARTA